MKLLSKIRMRVDAVMEEFRDYSPWESELTYPCYDSEYED